MAMQVAPFIIFSPHQLEIGFMAHPFYSLFTGGLLIGQLEVAEAMTWEAYFQYQQTVLNALQEVEDALIAHKKTKELLLVQELRVNALKDALALARLQYDNGQVDYLNVLDTENFLFAAELDLAQFQSNLFLSLVNFYKAIGGAGSLRKMRKLLKKNFLKKSIKLPQSPQRTQRGAFRNIYLIQIYLKIQLSSMCSMWHCGSLFYFLSFYF